MAPAQVTADGYIPDGVLENHLQIIAERGLDVDDYADQIAHESIMLARAIRDHRDDGLTPVNESAKLAYRARLATLESRENLDIDPEYLADRAGNPEVSRTGIVSNVPADHNPDPSARPANWVRDEDDRTPRIGATEDDDHLPDAEESESPDHSTGSIDEPLHTEANLSDAGAHPDDQPVRRGRGRPRKDATDTASGGEAAPDPVVAD